ncbi:hypothetical protein [Mycolicibacterium rhodesiae]|uniref:hypothetical protein n=1 Tax=Mycolicibacterium rhodesiae TaxID=36814 RepID=UPI0013012238|nr:hypothetical protein [Mycolicibacterium rhodesiae]
MQRYLYDRNQEAMLAAARIAMGWPIFPVISTTICLAVRVAVRALPPAHTGG